MIPTDDPNLSIAELMRRWPQTVPVFLRHRMLCVGCLINPFHTVADACAEYRLAPVDFAAELHAAIRGGSANDPADPSGRQAAPGDADPAR